MSIHGICFDEGQAGRCGLECRGFVGGECENPDEILELSDDMEILETGDHDEYLLKKYLGEIGKEVFYQQTEKEIDVYKFLKERILKEKASD